MVEIVKASQQAVRVKTVIIPAGTMLNRGPHEDDDCLLATKPIQAEVVGTSDGADIVRFPEGETQVVVYLHRPDDKK